MAGNSISHYHLHRAVKGVALARRRVRHHGQLIVISAMPKSASTFLANALARVLGYRHGYVGFSIGNIEQEIYLPKLIDVVGRKVVVQQHFKANQPNITLLADFGIKPVVQVRNLPDALVSLRDHLLTEQGMFPSLFPPTDFRSLPPERLLDLLVDFAAPWYISFFVSWQRAAHTTNPLWIRYEEAIADWETTIRRVLDAHQLDVPNDVVHEAVSNMRNKRGFETRLNVGVTGRGVAQLNEDQLERIDRLASHYPDVDFAAIGLAGCSRRAS